MESSRSWPPSWFDPDRHDLLTPLNVRALAHPVRLTLLRLLREDGPATASSLGERIGQSSGVTSYHLRTMAEAGLVVEDASLGNRRDRWWRAAHEATTFSFRVPGQAGDTEHLEVAEQYLRMVAQVGYERVLSWISTLVERQDELVTSPWQLGETSLSLTDDEARELSEQIVALVARYRRDQEGRARGPGGPDEAAPPGRPERRRAVFQFQLLPDPHPVRAEPRR
ncbi:helix-turn-helix domain-containing protein [Jiangella sp. DSM 45060]|uniref:winged helix-turn-helix domain-containing protein n=1 Tax=Jiangella sp. DSM 45060 TaxID=1798224 RepID=UPI00087B39BA|nr:helix-turn-helix domain-containing protein [Jiangella sp. DSM 45060]SDS29627.1 Helix-turn-helix domain-containing protein [Jiangella sp. DSM 45060]